MWCFGTSSILYFLSLDVYENIYENEKSHLFRLIYGDVKGKMVFISCDSGFRHNNLGTVYEYDVQDIPLTMCNLNLGLEERLEHINDGFGEFSKEVDCIDFKFNICEAKLKAIRTLLSHLTTIFQAFERK